MHVQVLCTNQTEVFIVQSSGVALPKPHYKEGGGWVPWHPASEQNECYLLSSSRPLLGSGE